MSFFSNWFFSFLINYNICIDKNKYWKELTVFIKTKKDVTNLRISDKSWPCSDLILKSLSRASSVTLNIPSMSWNPVTWCKESIVTWTVDEVLRVCQCSGSWKNWSVFSKEAMSKSSCVESWSVSSLSVITTTLINLTWVSNAEVVSDISPSISAISKLVIINSQTLIFKILTSCGSSEYYAFEYHKQL